MTRPEPSAPTPRQQEILSWVKTFIRDHGMPPTVREIGGAFEIKSSSVFDLLKALESKGHLRRGDLGARSLIVEDHSQQHDCGCVEVLVMGRVLAPERLWWLVGATILVTAIYGSLGLLVGIVANRLVGVYVVLFAATLDVFLYQNPTVSDPAWFASLLPAHYPTRLALDAAFTPVIDHVAVAGSLAYLVLSGGVAALAFRYTLAVE